MNTYNYSGITGEFLSRGVAREDPLEKNHFLIPANATTIPVPSLVINEAVIFTNGEWIKVSDFRNETYYLKSDGSKVIFELGGSPDDTMQKTFPADIKLSNERSTRKEELTVESDNLIDAQVGNSKNHMRMIAEGLSMLDAQVGKGQGNGRNPKQDVIIDKFNYVNEVYVSLDAAFSEIDTSSNPSAVTLVHPPLPGL